MLNKQSVSITLKTPKFGWLPVEIITSDFNLSFEASDLGLNVIDQLTDMVISISNNQASKCYFYLEPSAYLISLSSFPDKAILQISFLEDFDDNENHISEKVYECEINPSEFRASIITALQDFLSFDYSIDDWPEPEKKELLNNLTIS